ncbi:MAG: phosphodiester glycosidase family protein [Bdellovibrionales bacterium]|nr:phosphodiester glycosidase family protein [Bdellovibrionales bacterium]NQZ20262.1 phosphodiester glycosidase family protein [Bdellovibrionales bacterium]
MFYRIIFSSLVFVFSLTASASGFKFGPNYRVQERHEIAPGVEWESHVYEDIFNAKLETQVVYVDLDEAQALPMQYQSCKRISDVAEDRQALVAINGTFFDSGCNSRNLLKVNNVIYSKNIIRNAGSIALLINEEGEVSMRQVAKNENPSEATHGIGGFPQLMMNGLIDIQPKESTSFFTGRHPRTAVGVIDKNNIVLVAVDGRSSLSRGLTIIQLAEYMKGLGAQAAMNLDGGGSTVMWIEDEGIVNRPSSGERRVTDGLSIVEM